MKIYLKQVDKAIICQPPTSSDIKRSKVNNNNVTATAATKCYVDISKPGKLLVSQWRDG